MEWLQHNWEHILVWIGVGTGVLNALIAFLKVMGYPQASAWFGKLEDALTAAYQAFINSKKPPTAGLTCLLVILMAGSTCADTTPVVTISNALKAVPAIKQGMAYSLVDSRMNYLSTFDVLTYKSLSFELGYAGVAKNTGDKFVAVISYDIANLKKLGVTMPVLDLIDLRVGAYAGVGRINVGDAPAMRSNNEFDAGISATAISVKF